MTKVLVTGATGNNGGTLLPLLQKEGVEVLAGSTKGTGVNGAPGVAFDFFKPETLKAAFKNIDTVFLVLPSNEGPMTEMAQNVIDAAKTCGVKHLVKISVIDADSQSPFLFARAHGEVDDLLKKSGIPCTFLRCNYFMQNYINFYKEMIKQGTFYAAQANNATSFVDVRDIADVAAKAILNPNQHAGKTYLITGGEALTQDEVMGLMSQALGRDVQYVSIPPEAAEEAMRNMGLNSYAADFLSSLNRWTLQGKSKTISGDVMSVTGHAPRSLGEFVKENAQIWR